MFVRQKLISIAKENFNSDLFFSKYFYTTIEQFQCIKWTIWLNGGWFDQWKYPRIYEIIYDTMELLISSSEMALYIYIHRE